MFYPAPLTPKVDELFHKMSATDVGKVVKPWSVFCLQYGKMSQAQRELAKEFYSCLFEHFEEANQEEE